MGLQRAPVVQEQEEALERTTENTQLDGEGYSKAEDVAIH